jgi:CheY-like chemotaxis protein
LVRVLIADDDPMILRLLDVALGAAGHETTTAVDGREALDLLPQSMPDIVCKTQSNNGPQKRLRIAVVAE